MRIYIIYFLAPAETRSDSGAGQYKPAKADIVARRLPVAVVILGELSPVEAFLIGAQFDHERLGAFGGAHLMQGHGGTDDAAVAGIPVFAEKMGW